MPPLPSPGKVIELLLKGQLGTDVDTLNRIYFSYAAGPIGASDLTTWVGDVGTAYDGHMPAVLSQDFSLSEIIATDLSSDIGVRVDSEVDYNGAVDSASVPAGVAFVIRETIARRYRGGKPRLYICGLPATYTGGDQTWDSTHAAAVLAAWVGFVDAILGDAPEGWGTTLQCNVSYFEGFTAVENPVTHRYRNIPTPREAPVVDLITGYDYNPNFASQRRRNQQRTVR